MIGQHRVSFYCSKRDKAYMCFFVYVSYTVTSETEERVIQSWGREGGWIGSWAFDLPPARLSGHAQGRASLLVEAFIYCWQGSDGMKPAFPGLQRNILHISVHGCLVEAPSGAPGNSEETFEFHKITTKRPLLPARFAHSENNQKFNPQHCSFKHPLGFLTDGKAVGGLFIAVCICRLCMSAMLC